MKKTILLFFTINLLWGCSLLKNSVLFGENNLKDFDEENNTFKIYFDREGILYPPNCFIPNEHIKANSYSLMTNSQNTKSQLISYPGGRNCDTCFKGYNKFFHEKNSQIFLNKFNQLSIDRISSKINSILKDKDFKSVTFIMVGFNNTLYNFSDANNNTAHKLQEQRKKINGVIKNVNNTKTLFIEVYWDGTFTKKKGVKTALNYKKAIRLVVT